MKTTIERQNNQSYLLSELELLDDVDWLIIFTLQTDRHDHPMSSCQCYFVDRTSSKSL